MSQAGRKVPLDQIALLFRCLNITLSAGLPINKSLEVQMPAPDPHLQSCLQGVLERVENGAYLSEACRDFPQAFPPLAVSLLEVGENTGSLVKVSQQLGESFERTLKLRRAIMSALAYPAVLASINLVLTLFFLVILAPGKAYLSSTNGEEVSFLTKILSQVAGFITHPFLPLLALGILVAAIISGHMGRFVRFFFGDVVDRLPWIGLAFRQQACARYMDTLSTALTAGLPLERALVLGSSTVKQDFLRVKFDAMAQDVVELGIPLHQAAKQHDALPPLGVALMVAASESGEIANAARRIADFLEEHSYNTLLSLTRVLEPALLAFSGLIAFAVALHSLTPMIRLIQSL